VGEFVGPICQIFKAEEVLCGSSSLWVGSPGLKDKKGSVEKKRRKKPF